MSVTLAGGIEQQADAGEGNHQRENSDARQVSQVIGLQVDPLEVVCVDFEQSENIDIIRQHQTIDRAAKRCDDDVDRCDQHQGSMAAP
jgi:hypothetical protein